jgi:hypothetical protein
MQPLLTLSSLEHLDLMLRHHAPTAADLRQLAMLPLKAVKVNYKYITTATQTAADGQARLEAGTKEAWAALPLTELSMCACSAFVNGSHVPFKGMVVLSAKAGHALSSLHLLTELNMRAAAYRNEHQSTSSKECHLKLDAKPGQLAEALQGLTALQSLNLFGVILFLLVTRGGVTLLAGHTHQPDESDCGGLQHCCH